MKLKKVRAKCQVKGCRSTGNKTATYNVSASSEIGRSVIICEKCIKAAYELLFDKENTGEKITTEKEETDSQTAEVKKNTKTKNTKKKEEVSV